MSLRTTAAKVAPRRPGPSCGYGKALEVLDADDLAWLDEQFLLGKTATYVAEVLNADERIYFKVSDQMVRRHRIGRCGCDA